MEGDNFERYDYLFLWSVLGVLAVHFLLMGGATVVSVQKAASTICKIDRVVSLSSCEQGKCAVVTSSGFKGSTFNPAIGSFARVCKTEE